MKHGSRGSTSVCIVLQAAKQELEHTTNYVERIVALKNIAEILQMLTAYKDLGEEIEQTLMISANVSYQNISSYANQIKSLLAQQIHDMESVKLRH